MTICTAAAPAKWSSLWRYEACKLKTCIIALNVKHTGKTLPFSICKEVEPCIWNMLAPGGGGTRHLQKTATLFLLSNVSTRSTFCATEVEGSHFDVRTRPTCSLKAAYLFQCQNKLIDSASHFNPKCGLCLLFRFVQPTICNNDIC